NSTTQRFIPPMFGDYRWNAPLIPNRRGAFKIVENESPLPQNRLFVNYNYYSTIKNDLTTSTQNDHREVIGLEKILSSNISIELRVPFWQYQAFEGEDYKVGDPTLIVKYA